MVDYNAMYVLWLRDIKRFLRAKSRIIGMLMLPIFFLLGLGLGLGNLITFSNGTSYLEFLVPGIIGMSLLFTSISSGTAVLWDRQFGFLKEILVTPNSRFSIVIGRIAGGATTAVLQSIIIVVISLLIGFTLNISLTTLLAIVFMLLIAVVFISLGLTLGSIINDFQGFQLVSQFVTMPLFFLSNAIFPLSTLSSTGIIGQIVQYISYVNPLTYGVDGLRNALTGIGTFSIWVDLLVMFIASAILISIATYAFKKTEVG